jgi:hypothetical protein
MAKEKQPEIIAKPKHKVKFISTLYTYDFKFNSGDIAELTADQYEIAKKHNSIKDIVNG